DAVFVDEGGGLLHALERLHGVEAVAVVAAREVHRVGGVLRAGGAEPPARAARAPALVQVGRRQRLVGLERQRGGDDGQAEARAHEGVGQHAVFQPRQPGRGGQAVEVHVGGGGRVAARLVAQDAQVVGQHGGGLG